MKISETIKRTMIRARRRLDRYIGYENTDRNEGPSLYIEMPNGYKVHVSYHDLAFLVRAADQFAAKDGMPSHLKNWRDEES